MTPMVDTGGGSRRGALARMRHDLRTPLAVILGLAQVLESELTDEEQKKDIAHIIANGRQLETLIDRFVALAQDGTGDGAGHS